jgi:saccharopine dehydrogenase-like NADP-dependent oxidoreductase
MKILILGGAGIVGRAVVKDLVSQKDVSQVVIADVNIKKAEKFLDKLNHKKGSCRYLDISDTKALIELMKGFDVVGNCIYWGYLYPITQAAIAAKVSIADLGGMYYGTLKQMELGPSAENAGITILSGCGSSPGINNVLARYAAEKLDQVNEIHIRAGGCTPTPGSPPPRGAEMTVKTFLDEMSMKPMLYENGKLKEGAPLSGREIVRFPDPVGEKACYYSLHTELLTLPKFIQGVKTVSVKVPFPEEELARLRPLTEMGFVETTPVLWEGKEIVPRQFTEHILSRKEEDIEEEGSEIDSTVMWVTGIKDSVMTKYTFEYYVEHEKKWGNLKTASGMAIGLLMLGRNQIRMKGFAAPEQCIDPHVLLDEIKARGFEFREIEEKIRSF